MSQGCALHAQMKKCRCECGYTCGKDGRLRCDLSFEACWEAGHFNRTCDHDWSGPFIEHSRGGSVTCKNCGMSAETHDMMCGP